MCLNASQKNIVSIKAWRVSVKFSIMMISTCLVFFFFVEIENVLKRAHKLNHSQLLLLLLIS
jgi:hypothetical protein